MTKFDPSTATPEQVADYLASLRTKAAKPPKKKKLTKKKATAHKKAKEPKPPRDDSMDMVPITLFGRHNINGVMYGPGVVTAPRHVANQLAQQDQAAKTYDETHFREKAFIIGPGRGPGGGHSRSEVHPSFFQGDELRAPEAAVAEGSTANVQKDPSTGNLNWVQ